MGKYNYDKFTGNITGSSFFRHNYIEQRGTIGIGDILPSVKKSLSITPFKDSRYNGVVSGLKVFDENKNSSGNYSFKVESGFCYVQGKRIDINKEIIIDTDIVASSSSDKIFIAIDINGDILFRECLPNCSNPFSTKEYCNLSTIEYNSSSISQFDLRIFIDNLDLKILNSIKVSKENGCGHFKDIKSALSYAKRYSETFKMSKIPNIDIKSGEYKIEIIHDVSSSNQFSISAFDKITKEGLWIDFPVTISGEGESTILDITNFWTNTISSDKYTAKENRGAIYIAGPGLTDLPTTPGFSKLSSGSVTIKNLKLKNSRIVVLDSIIENSGTTLDTSINISNVVFDGDPKSGTATEFDRYSLYLKTINSSGLNKGNVRVNGCYFNKSSIFLEGLSENFKNIKLFNNNFLNLTNYQSLISQDDTSNLITNSFLDNHIYIYSNSFISYISGTRVAAGYFSPSDIIPAIAQPWSNRFSSQILCGEDIRSSGRIVGQELSIFGNATLSGDSIILSNSTSATGVDCRSNLESRWFFFNKWICVG